MSSTFPDPPELAVDGLSVDLRGRKIVDGVGFAACPGEHVVMVGPNGAGKTTLLRAIIGLLEHAGSVQVGDVDLRALTRRQQAQSIAYLPQEHAIHWPITVRELVGLGRLPHGGGRLTLTDADRQAIDTAIQDVDIGHLAERTATRLSGGETARALLARALAVNAPVVLADEPVAALDPRYRLMMMELLTQTAKSGRVVISVVHDLTLAARFADRILVINAGCLVAEGRPEEVLDDRLLADIFAIEAVRGERDSERYIVPWRAI